MCRAEKTSDQENAAPNFERTGLGKRGLSFSYCLLVNETSSHGQRRKLNLQKKGWGGKTPTPQPLTLRCGTRRRVGTTHGGGGKKNSRGRDAAGRKNSGRAPFNRAHYQAPGTPQESDAGTWKKKFDGGEKLNVYLPTNSALAGHKGRREPH